MSSKIYICYNGLSHCQWCSKDIYRGSKMLRFDGFSYGAISRFVDAVLQHKKNGLDRKIVRFMNQDILNKIMSYIIDENVLNLSVKPWLNKKYIHHDCSAAEMIHSCKVIHNIRNNSIADMVKTKYGREIKPVEKFQDISYVKGSSFDGCDQFDRGFDGDGSHGDVCCESGGNRLIGANLKGFVVVDDVVDDDDDVDDVVEWDSDYSSSEDEEWDSDEEWKLTTPSYI